jgi:hypothetical protein
MPITSINRNIITYSEIRGYEPYASRVSGTRNEFNLRRAWQSQFVSDELRADIEKLDRKAKGWILKNREEYDGVECKIPIQFVGKRGAWICADLMRKLIKKGKYETNKHVAASAAIASLNRDIRRPIISDVSIPSYQMPESDTDDQTMHSVFLAIESVLEDFMEVRKKIVVRSNKQVVMAHNVVLKQGDNFTMTSDKKAHRDPKTGKYCPVQDYVQTAMGKVAMFSGMWIVKGPKGICVMDHLHMEDLVDMMHSLAKLALRFSEFNTKGTRHDAYFKLIKFYTKLFIDEPNRAGEYIKAARNYAVALLDDVGLMGGSSGSMLLTAYTGDKRTQAAEIYRFYKSIMKDDLEIINLAHSYKLFPHPDGALEEAFKGIGGLKNPNKMKEERRGRVVGTLRKSIYLSMIDSGLDPRVQGGPDVLMDELVKARPDRTKLLKSDPLLWSTTEFIVNHSCKKMFFQELKAEDASSAPREPLDIESLRRVQEWYESRFKGGKGSKRPSEQIRPVNDKVDALNGNKKPTAEEAVRFLREAIKSHEKFEEVWREKGVDIDDIPSSELSKFVESNSFFLVLTEPKWGEYHKEVARLFYMAMPQVKSGTQAIERVARQISRKQLGVSITKSYKGKQADLAMATDLMRNSGEDGFSLFTSFDMSEFSKKFPMKLVREYGLMLGELTGVPELERIDLYFRNSVVVHDTRGVFKMMSGIKGGFEGFLNFVWTSIHAAIMEVALRELGRSGRIIVYSDDGLMQVWVESSITSSRKQVTKLIKSIQRIYSDHGLKFHLGKTIVAPWVWEFLGTVCYKGNIVQVDLKELASIGRFEKKSSYTPLKDRNDAINGQVSSYVKAQGNADLGNYLAAYYFSRYLARAGLLLPEPWCHFQLITPRSLGGYRIVSPSEMLVESEVTQDAYFKRELESLSRMFSAEVKSFCSYMVTILKAPKRSVKMLESGSLFKSTLPDTSGQRIASDILRDIEEKTNFKAPRNPLDGKLGNLLTNLYSSMDNISRKQTSAVIGAFPAVHEFHSEMSLASGSAPLAILSKGRIKMYQLLDTRAHRSSVNGWREGLFNHDGGITSVDTLFNAATNICFKAFRLAPLRMPPTMIFRKVPRGGDIEVSVRYFEGKTFSSSSYVEPAKIFSSAEKSLSWTFQADPNSLASKARRLGQLAISLLTEGQITEEFVSAIMELNGLDMFSISAGARSSLTRERKAISGRNDYQLYIPSREQSLVTVRPGSSLRTLFVAKGSYDRMSINHGAAAAYSYYISCNRRKFKNWENFPKSVYFAITTDITNIVATYKMTQYKELIYTSPKEVLKMDEELERQLTSGLDEALLLRNLLDGSYRTVIDTDITSAMNGAELRVIAAAELSKWMIKVHRASGYSGATPAFLAPATILTYQPALKTAFAKAMLSLLNPTDRDIVTLWAVEGQEMIDEKIYIALGQLAESIESMLTQLPNNLYVRGTVTTFYSDWGDFSGYLRLEALKNILGGVNKSKIPIISESQYAQRHVSSQRAAKLREMALTTVGLFYQLGKKSNWDTDTLTTLLSIPKGVEIDLMIDTLCIYAENTRASEHRTPTHVANPITMKIELLKFYNLVIINLRERGGKFDPWKSFLINEDGSFQESMQEHVFALLGIDTTVSNHGDHRIVMSRGIPKAAKKRISFYQRNKAAAENALRRMFRTSDTAEEIKRQLSSFHIIMLDNTNRNIVEVSKNLVSASISNIKRTGGESKQLNLPGHLKPSFQIIDSYSEEEGLMLATLSADITLLSEYGKCRFPKVSVAQVVTVLSHNNLITSDKAAPALYIATKIQDFWLEGMISGLVKTEDELDSVIFINRLSRGGNLSYNMVKDGKGHKIFFAAESGKVMDRAKKSDNRRGYKIKLSSRELLDSKTIEDIPFEAIQLASDLNIIIPKIEGWIVPSHTDHFVFPTQLTYGQSSYKSSKVSRVSDSPLLAAATAIAHMATTDVQCCYVYSLLLFHREGMKKISGKMLVERTRSLLGWTAIRKNNDNFGSSQVLCSDIRSSVLWCKNNPVETDDIYSTSVMNITKFVDRIPKGVSSKLTAPLLPGFPREAKRIYWGHDIIEFSLYSLVRNQLNEVLYTLPVAAIEYGEEISDEDWENALSAEDFDEMF